MIKAIKKLAIPIIALLSIGFVFFLINQISGVYLLASDLNPLFGKIVLITSIGAIGALLLTPFVVLIKMPKPLTRPKNEKELAIYKRRLLARLQKNTRLQAQGLVPKTIDDLKPALIALDEEADKYIKSTARTIFLTTAISQNGKLDALTVFLTQMRMVWHIAHVYYQRPSMRELAYLYGNIGATAFLATEIEDLDLTRQIEPIISSIAKNSSGRTLPVVGQATTVIMDSLLEGTTNCFLSLRVGIISKKYCNQLTVTTEDEIKQGTFKEASIALKKIALSSSGDFFAAILKATRNAGINTVKDGWESVLKTGTKMKETVKEVSKKISPF